MPTLKQIADFYGISESATKKWPRQRKQRGAVELEAGADPVIAGLLAELQRLAWVYNCANVRGTNQPLSCTVLTPTAASCSVNYFLEHSFTPERRIFTNLNANDAVSRLKAAKLDLEQQIYGAEKNAR